MPGPLVWTRCCQLVEALQNLRIERAVPGFARMQAFCAF